MKSEPSMVIFMVVFSIHSPVTHLRSLVQAKHSIETAQSREVVHVPQERLQLYQHSRSLIQTFALHPRHFVFGLYSAKTSGSTGKNTYRRMGGASDNDNFINNPLHPGSTMFHQPQKFLASHYTCAKDQVSRLLRHGKAETLVLFPIRESTSLITSAALQAVHHFCGNAEKYNLTVTAEGCIVPKMLLIDTVLLPKAREMGLTHVDCLNFDDLRSSLYISRSVVCFGGMTPVNTVVHELAASEGVEYTAVNINSEKQEVLVQLGDNVTVEASRFIEYNWPKISAGMSYVVSEEHRWLENLVIQHPGSFFCNHDTDYLRSLMM